MHPDFETYCLSKKIDPDRFQKNEPKLYLDLQRVFEQVHPNSFTAQKLYLINDIRRRYTSTLEVKPTAGSKPQPVAGSAKPKMGIPKPALKKPTNAPKPVIPKPAGMPKPIIPNSKEKTPPTTPKPALKPLMGKPTAKTTNTQQALKPLIPKKSAALAPKIPSPKKENNAEQPTKLALKPKIPPKK